MFSRRVTVFGGTRFLGRRIVRHLHIPILPFGSPRGTQRNRLGRTLSRALLGFWGGGLRCFRTRRRGSDLRAFAAAAPRFAVSLSAASLASRSARRRAVFAASACREGVLALVSELTFIVVLNCSSARRRLASPGRGWERIGAASSL